jgi:hypothetical protein
MNLCCIKYSIIYDINLTIVGIPLSQSANGFSSRRYGFNPKAVNVGFVVDKVVQMQVFSSKHFHVSLPIIISPMFHTHVLHLHHHGRLCYSSVSHWLSTMAAWVPSQVMWNLWLWKWPWRGFLMVLQFLLSILIQPAALHSLIILSLSDTIYAWYWQCH